MPRLQAVAFKLTADDIAFLDAIREYNGLLSRSEAMRFALRYWARAEGVTVPKPQQPNSKRPRRTGRK